jgi:HD-GYP domain-containing protein (c-di-GMP phosphodiesterase class II)
MTQANSYYPISLKVILVNGKPCPFDLFIKRAEGKYTKIHNKDELIDSERLKNYYENKQVLSVYIDSCDRDKYRQIVDLAFIKLKHITDEGKTDVIDQLEKIVDTLVVEIVGQEDIEDKVVFQAGTLVKSCISILNQDMGQLAKLIRSFSNYEYCFKHSLIVSIMSIIVAKGNKIQNPKVLEYIALAGFLHDLTLEANDFELENKSGLSKEDAFLEHPIKTAEILKQSTSIPSEVILIIQQHHEMPNGNGYPNKLYLSDIYYPARILAIADRFSFLITPRENHIPLKGYEAIVEMLQTKGAYDKNILTDFARILNFKV